VREKNSGIKLVTFDRTPEELQKKWTETLRIVFKDFESTWDKPSPEGKRPVYRMKTRDMMSLMMGEYQGRA
jgi:hypothetical protein